MKVMNETYLPPMSSDDECVPTPVALASVALTHCHALILTHLTHLTHCEVMMSECVEHP